MPVESRMQAPDQINVYTDGSWLYPLKQYLGLGGAGVWWKGRTFERKYNEDNNLQLKVFPMSKAEKDMAHFEQKEEGLRLYTKIGGFSGSSTRTELAAGILAISAYGGVHIGSDSRAFVDKAQDYLEMIKNGKEPQKPWKLISDGDLWQHFFDAAKAKGVGTIKLTWVKGHATQEHIDRGITTAEKLAGNHEADTTADLGTELHGKELIKIAGKMQTKHKAYTRFMMEITKHIIEAYTIHRELIEREEEHTLAMKEKYDDKVQYTKLEYANESDSRLWNITSSINYYKAYMNKTTCSKDLESFLNNMLISETCEGTRGITWIELYTLYRLIGYDKPIPDSKHAGKAKTPPVKQLAKFQKELKATAKRVMIGQSDLNLLNQSKAMPGNLKGVGINGKHPTLGFNVALSEQGQTALATALIKLTRIIKKKDVKSFQEGSLKIQLRDLKMRGKVAWDEELPIQAKPKRQEEEHTNHEIIKAKRSAHGRCTAFFKCPLCLAPETSDCKSFQYEDLDYQHQCIECGKKRHVKEWLCECDNNWHLCRLHRYARCHVDLSQKQKQATKDQTQAAEQPKGKRIKIKLTSAEKGTVAEIKRTKAEKRLRSQDEMTENVTIHQAKMHKWTLKRKREDDPNVLIDLGSIVHNDFNPHLYGPVLKKRFYGG